MPALPDYLGPALDVILVGINPGLRSAELGHHFAGPGNRFWRLLHESGLVSERLGYEDDHRLPDFGIGLTNIVARESRSSTELDASDYASGRRALAAKIRKLAPRVVGLVGVTVFRELWEKNDRNRPPSGSGPIACGLRRERFEGVPLFVLPNPSGRNAHFTYEAMLAEWRRLSAYLRA